MKQFPFETVYEHFARRAVAAGLPKDGQHPPMLFVVRVNDGEIDAMEDFPVARFFGHPQGKTLLGRLLQNAVPMLPDNACLLLISEAYMRHTNAMPGESAAEARTRENIPDSLEDDPLAEEILLFQMYRPGTQRMGRLPIRPGRVLEYRPLDKEYMWSEGRLAPDTTRPGDRGAPQ